MSVPLMLFICLTAIFTPNVRGTQATSETEELGKVINLAKTNLLGDFKEREASIFESFPSQCFKKEKLNSTKSHYEYYASTKAFYSKLATEAGLDASLQSAYSLRVTLNSVTKSISSHESKVSGISLIVEALTEKIHLVKDCLNDETFKFKKSFMEDLEQLPLEIDEPWQRNSWIAYRRFMEKYGSHVVNSVMRGARMKQMSFAQSSKSYSEREFQVKSCVSLAGPTSAGKVGVSACANVSKSESSSASHMSTNDKTIVRGGSDETRSKLLHDKSKELIEKFLNEASMTPSSVQYTFRAVWNILQSRLPSGTPNYVRGVNLQYYYLGFLNYGCSHIKSGGVEIQKFDYTKRSEEMNPEYECSLAKEGCHSDDDCRYKPIWCSCRGSSCVHYKSVEQDTGKSKKTAYANTNQDWGWHGCDWKVAGSYCACYNKDRDWRKVVWSLPSRDAPVHKARSYGFHRQRGKGSMSE
ncbi:hypothetical protein OS493_017324 [Desmophyllum pertusum]|uniref:MACPF domain-containing protein n=1 Tax=Desmophyllum pertusum TaxID=174260 RepID=A0A9X0A190_9CNID|nr:hypothetical protein OS493_017324 [Desmophyllum pertusum]